MSTFTIALLLSSLALCRPQAQPICGEGQGGSATTIACGDSCLRTDSLCASCVNDICVLEPPQDADSVVVDLVCPGHTLEESCSIGYALNYCNGQLCEPGESCLADGSCGPAEFDCGTFQCPNDAFTACDETNSRCTTFNAVCPGRSLQEKCVDAALYISAPVRDESDEAKLAVDYCSLTTELCEPFVPTPAPTSSGVAATFGMALAFEMIFGLVATCLFLL